MMRTLRGLQDWLPDNVFLRAAVLFIVGVVTMMTATLVLTAATLTVLR